MVNDNYGHLPKSIGKSDPYLHKSLPRHSPALFDWATVFTINQAKKKMQSRYDAKKIKDLLERSIAFERSAWCLRTPPGKACVVSLRDWHYYTFIHWWWWWWWWQWWCCLWQQYSGYMNQPASCQGEEKQVQRWCVQQNLPMPVLLMINILVPVLLTSSMRMPHAWVCVINILKSSLVSPHHSHHHQNSEQCANQNPSM